MGFEKIVNKKEYTNLAEKQDKAQVENQLRKMLFEQLEKRGNLLTSAAWYLTEDQALKFAQMTLDELNDTNSNGSREVSLLEEILKDNPFKDIIDKDSITFVDLGCGNGVKAARILPALAASRLNYYPVDTSPYMGIFCMANICDLLEPSKDCPSMFFNASQLPDSRIGAVNSLTKEILLECLHEHKQRLFNIEKAYQRLMGSKGMKHYLEEKRSEWFQLPFEEQALLAQRDNDYLDYVLGQEGIISSRVTEDDPKKIKERIEELYHQPFDPSYSKVRHQIELFEKCLHRVRETHPDGTSSWLAISPRRLLDEYEKRICALNTIEDLFKDKELLRFARVLTSTIYHFGERSIKEFDTLREELNAGDARKLYGRFHKIEQQLYEATFVKPTGGLEIVTSMNGNGQHFEFIKWRNQGYLRRPEKPFRYTKEFKMCQPVSFQYCDFLNGDLLTLFKSVVYHDSTTLSRHVVGLLGQTIGNFNLEDRMRIVQHVYSAIEPGSHFILGAELRPSEEDPNYKEKVETMRKYYGAPELNDGKMGEGERFLRYATKQLGIKDEDLEYHVDFNNNRIEMYFTVKNDTKAVYSDRSINLPKDYRLLMATSYKFNKKELTDLLEQTGFKITHNPDRYGYTVIMARK